MMDPRILRAYGIVMLLLAMPLAVLVGVETVATLAGHPFVTGLWEQVTGPICHHIAERTPPGAPVCARCIGMYEGYLVAVVVGTAGQGVLARGGRTLANVAVPVFVAAGIAVLAALAEMFGAIATGNAVRIGLGVPLGVAPAFVFVAGAAVVRKAAREAAQNATAAPV